MQMFVIFFLAGKLSFKTSQNHKRTRPGSVQRGAMLKGAKGCNMHTCTTAMTRASRSIIHLLSVAPPLLQILSCHVRLRNSDSSNMEVRLNIINFSSRAESFVSFLCGPFLKLLNQTYSIDIQCKEATRLWQPMSSIDKSPACTSSTTRNANEVHSFHISSMGTNLHPGFLQGGQRQNIPKAFQQTPENGRFQIAATNSRQIRCRNVARSKELKFFSQFAAEKRFAKKH